MKLVIEIDDKTYADIKKGKIYSSIRDVPQESIVAIANGTPLPQKHGRLIDADDTEKTMLDVMCGTGYQTQACDVVRSEFYSPTVIEGTEE